MVVNLPVRSNEIHWFFAQVLHIPVGQLGMIFQLVDDGGIRGLKFVNPKLVGPWPPFLVEDERATKRCRGKLDDVCAKCKKGGELVECDTCSQSMHPGCDKQMLTNVWPKNAAYQCPCCQRENISQQTYTSESEEEIRQPQKTQKHKNTYVETDSEDENHGEHTKPTNNTANNKNQTDMPKMVESRDDSKNKGETTTCTNTTTNDLHQQNTSIGLNVESDSDDEDTGKKHPNQTTRKADTPRTRTTKKQRLGKRNKRDITIQPTLQTNEHPFVTVETECKKGKHTGNTIAPNTISESKTQQQQTQREELHKQNALQLNKQGPK